MKPFVLVSEKTDSNTLNFLKANSDKVDILSHVPLPEAKEKYFDKFISEWDYLTKYIANPSGSKPRSFNHKQYFAFSIKRSALDGIKYLLNPAKIGCVFCINQYGTVNDPADDVISLMLMGVNMQDAVTGFAVIEKWPGLYSDKTDYDARVLEVKDKALTAENGDVTNYWYGWGMLQSFKEEWKALTDYLDNNGNTPKPNIRLEEHPLVFLFDTTALDKLLMEEVDSIAAILGLDVSEGGIPFIKPFFVGLNAAQRPITKLFFPKATNYTRKKYNEIVSQFLTEQLNGGIVK